LYGVAGEEMGLEVVVGGFVLVLVVRKVKVLFFGDVCTRSRQFIVFLAVSQTLGIHDLRGTGEEWILRAADLQSLAAIRYG
jgi:hypothetical protein